MEASVPVYLITGFLESGKTTLLKDTLAMEHFNDGQRTVLLRCEEGELDYDPAALQACNCRLVSIDQPEQLTPALLQDIEHRLQPQRVLVEYNGMWPLDHLRALTLPEDWGLFQVITVIDATTFALYRTNMPSMISDMAGEADMVFFNRCTPDTPMPNWKRGIRALNPRCEIVFEDKNGEELEVPDLLPYSLSEPHLVLSPDDYGVWYLDIQEHPERYVEKTITFTAQALVEKKLPPKTFIPGRNAMTCCEDDIRFFGFLCKYDKLSTLKRGQWVQVTAAIRWENAPVYEGEGVVLYAQSVQPTDPPKEPLVYFR